jgi:DnaJ-like protein
VSRPFSAYAALELEPGADRAAIEAAYRRLIKLHHPDRSGGDAERAAEINRAYRELRAGPLPDPVLVRTPSRMHHRRHRRRVHWWPLIAAAVVVFTVMQGDEILQQRGDWATRLSNLGVPVAAKTARSKISGDSVLDGPIDSAAVADSIGEAVRMVKGGDEGALIQHSRNCHRNLRLAPNLMSLDRCAAFDSATAALLDLDPNKDTGQFNASSVTARQLTAASLLSGDYLAIERRLNRIRSQVEMTLMPPAPSQAPEPIIEAEP